MYPSERLNPSFTTHDEEAGVPENLAPIVMGPPAYASPDPRTNAGALVAIDEHPLAADISEDYAADLLAGRDPQVTTLGAHLDSDEDPFEGLPEDREEWTKADWQKAAAGYKLSTNGTKDVLQKRVEEHETELEAAESMNASEWVELVDQTDNVDDLGALKARYETTGNDYATVNKAFEKRQAEFDGNDE